VKTCYIDSDTRTVCDLSIVHVGSYEVNRINTPPAHRGKGHASRLMREVVLPEADAEGARLRLMILPTGNLDWQSLAAWYYRLGFRPKDKDGTTWQRLPIS